MRLVRLASWDVFLGVAYVFKSALHALFRSDGRGAGLIGYCAADLVTRS